MVVQEPLQGQLQAAEEYVNNVYELVKQRNPHESEFHQAVKEIFLSLTTVFAKYPQYIEHNILERLVEPERMITFRVPWVDDKGKVQVNRGLYSRYSSGGNRNSPSWSFVT